MPTYVPSEIGKESEGGVYSGGVLFKIRQYNGSCQQMATTGSHCILSSGDAVISRKILTGGVSLSWSMILIEGVAIQKPC